MKKFTALLLMLIAFAFFTSAWAPGLSTAPSTSNLNSFQLRT